MAHVREQVRSAITTLLNTTPTAWGRAYNSRIPPMQQVWPYLMLWTESETIVEETIHPSAMQLREMLLTVEGRVQLPQRETEELEARMDDVAIQIETRLTLATVQAALAKVNSFRLTDVRLELAVDHDNVPSYGAIVMSYLVGYTTTTGTPETLV